MEQAEKRLSGERERNREKEEMERTQHPGKRFNSPHQPVFLLGCSGLPQCYRNHLLQSNDAYI